ncbi:MAG: hypothetical protein KAW45_02900 [Thermoplasmatales archaeon]|nr:hypothetical protein [Thermoplasmatales archaeon]
MTKKIIISLLILCVVFSSVVPFKNSSAFTITVNPPMLAISLNYSEGFDGQTFIFPKITADNKYHYIAYAKILISGNLFTDIDMQFDAPLMLYRSNVTEDRNKGFYIGENPREDNLSMRIYINENSTENKNYHTLSTNLSGRTIYLGTVSPNENLTLYFYVKSHREELTGEYKMGFNLSVVATQNTGSPFGWKPVDEWSGTVSGTFYNRSLTPIFPPTEDEKKGIRYEKRSNLIKYNREILVFSLDFISIPAVGKEDDFAEYYMLGEKIVAINFRIENSLSNYSVFSNATLSFISQYDDVVKSIDLELDKNITELDTPLILDTSGFWKIRIDFTMEEDNKDTFYVFENVSKWELHEDKNYLSFFLENESIYNFQNHYEKCVPVYSMSEYVELQQRLILSDTARSLESTAKSVEDIANSQFKHTIIIAISTISAAVIGVIIGAIISKWRREENK